MSSTELLYQGILPSLPQYMVGGSFIIIIFFSFICVKVNNQAEGRKLLMIDFHTGLLVKISNTAERLKCRSKSSRLQHC